MRTNSRYWGVSKEGGNVVGEEAVLDGSEKCGSDGVPAPGRGQPRGLITAAASGGKTQVTVVFLPGPIPVFW